MDGSRLEAMSHRLKLPRNVYTPMFSGCVAIFYDLYWRIARHCGFDPEAAVWKLPRTIALLDKFFRDTLVVGEQLSGMGIFFAILTAYGLMGGCQHSPCQSLLWA
jgi:hypothetical protein